jgi:hypothetical protein
LRSGNGEKRKEMESTIRSILEKSTIDDGFTLSHSSVQEKTSLKTRKRTDKEKPELQTDSKWFVLHYSEK